MNYHLPVSMTRAATAAALLASIAVTACVRLVAIGSGGGCLSEPAHHVRHALSRGRRH